MFPNGRFSKAFGRSIKIDDRHWAFIPAPLPPVIEYSVEVISLLADAHGEVGRLDGIAERLPNPDMLVMPYMRLESLLSSKIEGTQTSLDELLLSEAQEIEDDGSGNIREVLNHMAAMKLGLARLAEDFPVSLRLVRELHRRLLQGVRGHARRGEFRDAQVHIGPQNLGMDYATYVPPPAHVLTQLTDNWERFIVEPPENMHVLVQLEREVLRQPLLYLSAYLEAHRAEYYDRLLAVSRDGDWTGWLEFFLRGVAVQAQAATRYCRELVALREDYRVRVQERTRSTNALALLDSLFDNPVITVPRAAKIMGVAYPTARSLVLGLLEMGILSRLELPGRKQFYSARQLLDVLRRATLPPDNQT